MYNYRAGRSIRARLTTGERDLFQDFTLTIKLPRLGVEAGLEVGGGGCQGLVEVVPGQGPQLGLHLGGAARHATRADLEVDS